MKGVVRWFHNLQVRREASWKKVQEPGRDGKGMGGKERGMNEGASFWVMNGVFLDVAFVVLDFRLLF